MSGIPTFHPEIYVLLYGNHFDLHTRVLLSILDHTTDGTYSLRVGCNEVIPETLKFINQTVNPRVKELKLFVHEKNIYKYPLMREMFAQNTAETIIWFDDDTYVNDSCWMPELQRAMIDAPDVTQFGDLWSINIHAGTRRWIEAASWYKKLPLMDHPDRRMQAGGFKLLRFCTGGWWAIRANAIKVTDWPDSRLRHNGGDSILGEALRQNGFTIQQHAEGVMINQAKRRGFSESYPTL